MTNMPTVLIIESNPIFSRTLKGLIRRKFPELRITEAQDAEEGRRKAVYERPQLIITDLHLKGDIALPMIRNIALTRPESRIVVLSDMEEHEYRKAAMDHGADDFLAKKGKNSPKVLSIIQKHLSGACSPLN